jgi:hypothetical protein
MMLDGEIERYNAIEFHPFLRNPPEHFKQDKIHNTFTGYYLEEYIPTRKVDPLKTTIMAYHNIVFGWQGINDPYTMTSLSKFMWERTAFKLQYPSTRQEWINVLTSKEQGTGKSTYTRWLMALFGIQYVKEHLDLESYLNKDFNIQNSSKLFQTIEEMHGVRSKTRRIYQLTTCGSREFHAKYEKSVTLNEYHELYCMSNLPSASLHVLAEDRRICIWDVNPIMKGNKEFWDKFNAELKDLDTLHAIYTWLKNMDVKDFDYKTLHPKLVFAKQDVVIDQKQNSHAFIPFLYEKHDWCDFGNAERDPYWSDSQKFYIKYKGKEGRYMVRVCQDTLYKQYRFYIKNKCTGTYRKDTTFFKELVDIGITVHTKPVRLGSKMRKCVDIEYDKVNKEWNRIYKVDCPPFSFNNSKYALRVHRFFRNLPNPALGDDTESDVGSDSEE